MAPEDARAACPSGGRGWTSGLGCAGLGLGQYEQAFRDNDVDAEVLRELTGDDLKDLGVSLVGHRRRLLAALAALREEATSPGAYVLPPRADRLPPLALSRGLPRPSGDS